MPSPQPSWGRYPRAEQRGIVLQSRFDPLPKRAPGESLLPQGLARSYGDVCLNHGGSLLLTRPLDQWMAFDPQTGILEAEAGISFAEILTRTVPEGWFLPVTPGTRFVTLGGAIANDVHGKNHHRAGTLGAHVLGLELLRSDGSRTWCSRSENATRFRATLGGLGLTGLITRARLQLRAVRSPWIDEEQIRMPSLEAFFDLADASDSSHEHTVAWIDTLAPVSALGRGIFIRGNHADASSVSAPPLRHPRLSIPCPAPDFLLNRSTIRAFNFLYARKFSGPRHVGRTHYAPFFYPLDVLGGWNKLYGKRGFFQHQCVVPRGDNGGPVRDMLRTISASGQPSFLAVLKIFGNASPEGLLSFPRPGVTLALDFPNRGPDTLALLRELDAIVFANGGALYPAKDARMTPEQFARSFPALDLFTPHTDPAFSSSFWRRVHGDPSS